MLEFSSVVFIVFGVLQIILFFKLWGMTNNVKKLKNQIVPDMTFFEVRKNIVLGNKREAKELLINDFFKKIESNEYSFQNAKNELEENLKTIGEEMPDNLININSYNDFYNLFWTK